MKPIKELKILYCAIVTAGFLGGERVFVITAKGDKEMKRKNSLATSLKLVMFGLFLTAGLYAQGGRPPDHETMWYNGNIVHITASDWLPNRAPIKVQNNVYVVVYPIGWQELGLATPQCDPCDHAGNGIGFDDFHDHVLDSVPGVVGYTGLRHVNVILPNYSFLSGGNDTVRDAALSVVYASHFPVTSVDAVNQLLNSTAPDGSPLAIFIDAGFYIRLSVSGNSN
jgi:hypothetical protein